MRSFSPMACSTSAVPMPRPRHSFATTTIENIAIEDAVGNCTDEADHCGVLDRYKRYVRPRDQLAEELGILNTWPPVICYQEEARLFVLFWQYLSDLHGSMEVLAGN